MEEKTIIKSELKDAKLVGISLPLGAFAIYFIVAMYASRQYSYLLRSYRMEFDYGFGFGNGFNYFLIPAIFIMAFLGYVIYSRLSKVNIVVTDKRVYGNDAWGKRVDLPLDSITAVGTSLLSGIAVTTASGAIKFLMLKNRDDIHKEISKLLINRQGKERPVAETIIKQEMLQSNADELKKYKDLLDEGIISQEEFDAKKKQLLDLW